MRRRILDRLVWIAMLLAFLMGVTACTTTSGSFCSIASPVYYHQRVYDAMTDAEAAKTLTSQKTGEKLCGWQHP